MMSSQRAENEIAVLKKQMKDLELLVQANAQGSGQNQPFWVVEKEEIQILSDSPLGRGGWGHVDVAIFRGQRVAAKTLHSDILSSHNIRLFTREMNMAARSRHPNLLQFIGATIRGEPIILTELMEISLRKLLGQKLLSPKQVVTIAKDVARALNYLHLIQPSPIIHRDISSSNVLLDPLSNDQWKAKIADYGSSNFMAHVSTTGPGNANYAAPESWTPALQSPKMDVFSFAVLLIEMNTAQIPTRDVRGVLMLQIKWPKMVNMVKQCMEQEPSKRPDMSKVLADLEGIITLPKNTWS